MSVHGGQADEVSVVGEGIGHERGVQARTGTREMFQMFFVQSGLKQFRADPPAKSRSGFYRASLRCLINTYEFIYT